MELRKNEDTVIDFIKRAANNEFHYVKSGAAILIPVVFKGLSQGSQIELVK